MAEVFAELQRQDSAAEWLALLIDREAASRETKRFEARMRSARLRHVNACPEDGRLPRAARPRQGAVPEPAQRQMDYRQAQPDHHRPLWGQKNLARVRRGATG